MPRSPRLDFPGARHHVMNRSARREGLFLDDATCAMLLDAVAEVPVRFGARIHGYALMPNHYHLMVEVPRGNLSRVMRHIGAVFTQAFNRQHGHDGPVFRGRFRNELVQDDAYWMHLLAYLHLNPVRAGIATRPEHCLWTSHQAYTNRDLRPAWLSCDDLLAQFGSIEALVSYVDAVRIKRQGAPDGFDPERFWVAGSTVEAPAVPAPRMRTKAQALSDVAGVLGVAEATVLERSPRPERNVPAWLGIWWWLRATDATQAEIARDLGLSRPRVSQLLKKLHACARDDVEVRAAMATLEALLDPA